MICYNPIGLHIPVVLDLVTDRVRMRAANVAVFMMYARLFASSFLSFITQDLHFSRIKRIRFSVQGTTQNRYQF